MKRLIILAWFITLLANGITAMADCQNPRGVEELIECAAENHNLSTEEFYYQNLFDLENILHGFCQETTASIQGYTNDGLYYRYENGALL